MSIKFLFVTTLSTVLLAGCSSKNSSSSNNSTNSENQYFFGLVFCKRSYDSGSPITTGNTTAGDTTTGDTDSNVSPAIQTDVQNMTNSDTEVDCPSEQDKALPGPGVGETGTGTLNYGNSELALTAAAVHSEVIGDSRNSAELEYTLILHDGDTRSSRVSSSGVSNNDGADPLTYSTKNINMGVYNASVAFIATLIQTGTDILTDGSFEVIAPSESTEAGDTNIAVFSALLQDKNADGTINEKSSEVVRAISGNINISGVSPDRAVSLDVTLEDGSILTGVYNGSFHAIPSLSDNMSNNN